MSYNHFEELTAVTRRMGGFGFEIKRDGTVNALTQRAHYGRPSGPRIWIGSVARRGSGWAAYTTIDVGTPSLTGFTRQQDAGRALYNGWLAS